jgi:hypothetical protein
VFSLSYDRRHNVLMARFTGVLSSQDVEELDKAVIAFTVQHGGPWHGLVDLTGVDTVSMPASRLLQRSQRPPVPGYRRVFVASGEQAVELARTFASHQTAAGLGTVQVVSTLEEAYRLLHLPKEPRFDPVA